MIIEQTEKAWFWTVFYIFTLKNIFLPRSAKLILILVIESHLHSIFRSNNSKFYNAIFEVGKKTFFSHKVLLFFEDQKVSYWEIFGIKQDVEKLFFF